MTMNRQDDRAGSGEALTAPATNRLAMSAEADGLAPVAILASMMLLAPTLGVPVEEMVQDTLKSIIVSIAALGAALVFFWNQRDRHEPLRWHAIVWLPILLMVYAASSMAWSHTYLAGAETIRWFLFALLVWLGLNTLSLDRLPILAWGVHLGAVIASLWAVLQFWFDFSFFVQGARPGSTFYNRNFFAEFAVCTLPFSALLLARARQSASAALLAASWALVIVAIMMTGTRSALVALWLQLLVLPVIAWRHGRQLPMREWSLSTRAVTAGVFVLTVLVIGLINTGAPAIAQEGRGQNALERAFHRTTSISTQDSSLGMRLGLWKATARLIQERPFAGVGAGAWQVEIPLFQERDSELENDFHAHNEFLQLLAEYGLAGWLCLLSLAAYLLLSFWRTLKDRGAQAQLEAPWRAVLLCSLMSLFIVSNLGFPWQLAATGALFALCLGALAATDARLGYRRASATTLAWGPLRSQVLAAIAGAGIVMAAYITQQASACEQKIVQAIKIGLAINQSGEPNNPRWNGDKAEMLKLIREAIAINPHYRRLTPSVANELAKWGDWRNAVWIWESVLASRPHIAAIAADVARGYMVLGRPAEALAYLDRAKRIRPQSLNVRATEVILLRLIGEEARALDLARKAIADGINDLDLHNSAFILGLRAGDFALAEDAIRLRMTGWPATRLEGYLQLGQLYAEGLGDQGRALGAFKNALALAGPMGRPNVLQRIPPAYRALLEFSPVAE